MSKINSPITPLSASLLVLAVLVSSLNAATTRVYVDPADGCKTGCTGAHNDPYDNLYAALQHSHSDDDFEVVLFKSTTGAAATRHYAFVIEYSDTTTPVSSMDLSGSPSAELAADTVIKPLYCTDSAVSTHSLGAKCIAEGNQETVYVKSSSFSLFAEKSLRVENIIFNHYDDVQILNPEEEDADERVCTGTRVECCATVSQEFDGISGNVYCKQTPTDGTGYQGDNAMFRFGSDEDVEKTIELVNVEFRGLQLAKALISIYEPNYRLIIDGLTFVDSYFTNSMLDIGIWEATSKAGVIEASNINFGATARMNLESAYPWGAFIYIFSSGTNDNFEFTDITITGTSVLSTPIIWTNTLGTTVFGDITVPSTASFSSDNAYDSIAAFQIEQGTVTFDEIDFQGSTLAGPLLRLQNWEGGKTIDATIGTLYVEGTEIQSPSWEEGVIDLDSATYKVTVTGSTTFKGMKIQEGYRLVDATGEVHLGTTLIQNCEILTGFYPADTIYASVKFTTTSLELDNNEFYVQNFFQVSEGTEVTLGAVVLKEFAPKTLTSYGYESFIYLFAALDKSSSFTTTSITIDDGGLVSQDYWLTSAFIVSASDVTISLGDVTITNTDFENFPLAISQGDVTVGTLTIQDCSFANYVNLFQIDSASFTIETLDFIENEVVGDTYNRDQFFLMSGQSTFTVTTTANFRSNEHIIKNGFYEYIRAASSTSTININKFDVIDNVYDMNVEEDLGTSGNSVKFLVASGTVTIDTVNIEDNDVDMEDQYLEWLVFDSLVFQEATVTIQQLTVAETSTKGYSRIIYGEVQSNIIINKARISGNEFKSQSPVIELVDEAHLLIRDGKFTENTIECPFIFGSRATADLSTCQFKNNSLDTTNAFIMQLEEGQSKLREFQCIGNTYSGLMQPFQLDRNSKVQFIRGLFSQNVYEEQAVGFIVDRGSNITFEGTEFNGEDMKDRSMLLTSSDGYVYMDQVKMKNMLKEGLSDDPSTEEITNAKDVRTKFNMGAYGGAEFYVFNTTFSTFAMNFLVWGSTLNITNSTFDNFAHINNDKRFLKASQSNIYLLDVYIVDHESEEGVIDNLIDVDNSVFTSNNLNVQDITIEEGFVLKFASSQVILRDLGIKKVLIDTFEPVIQSTLSGLYIVDSTFTQTEQILYSFADELINLKYVSVGVEYDQIYTSMFEIEETQGVIVEKCSFTFKTGNELLLNLLPQSALVLSKISTQVTIISSIFTGAKTLYGAIWVSQGDAQVMILGNEFNNNTGYAGAGAIGVTNKVNGTVYIVNSEFNWNTALTKDAFTGGLGGALYFQTRNDSTNLPEYDIARCKFSHNRAQKFGGAIYSYGIEPQYTSDSTFDNNTVSDGTVVNHFGTHPIRVAVINYSNKNDSLSTPVYNKDISTTLDIPELSNGAIYTEEWVFGLLDMFGQVCLNDQSAVIVILTPDEGNVEITPESLNSVDGIFDLQGLLVTADPDVEDFTLEYGIIGPLSFVNVELTEGDRRRLQEEEEDVELESFGVKFRECGQGEYVDETTGLCSQCLPGQKLLEPEGHGLHECEQCDTTMWICRGGDEVGVLDGYWRLNSSADIALLCPLEEACVGSEILLYRHGADNVSATGTCVYPYEGPLCNSCVEGFGKSNDGTSCYDCGTDARIFLQVVGALFFLTIIIYTGVKVTLDSEDTVGNQKPHKKALLIKRVAITRMLINYFQKIGIVASINIRWNEGVQRIARLDESVTIAHSDIFAFDCTYSDYKISSPVRKIFMKALLTDMIMPMFALATIIVLMIYYKWYKKQNIRGNARLKHHFWVCMLIMFVNHIISLFRQNLYMFSCKNIYRADANVWRMSLDYETTCWEGLHLAWSFGLSFPIMALCIGLPLYYLRKIKKDKRVLLNPYFRRRWFFLYGGYKPEFGHWEIMVFLEKIFLLFVIFFAFFHSAILQIYLILYIQVFTLFVHFLNKPYSEKVVNRMETVSQLIVMGMNLFGLYFGTIRDTDGLDEFVASLGGLIMIGYQIWWLLEFKLDWKWKIQAWFQKKHGHKKEKSCFWRLILKFVGRPPEEDLKELELEEKMSDEQSPLRDEDKAPKVVVQELEDQPENVNDDSKGKQIELAELQSDDGNIRYAQIGEKRGSDQPLIKVNLNTISAGDPLKMSYDNKPVDTDPINTEENKGKPYELKKAGGTSGLKPLQPKNDMLDISEPGDVDVSDMDDYGVNQQMNKYTSNHDEQK